MFDFSFEATAAVQLPKPTQYAEFAPPKAASKKRLRRWRRASAYGIVEIGPRRFQALPAQGKPRIDRIEIHELKFVAQNAADISHFEHQFRRERALNGGAEFVRAASITPLSMATVPERRCRSSNKRHSRCRVAAESHDASSAGSSQKFFLLRRVSSVRKL